MQYFSKIPNQLVFNKDGNSIIKAANNNKILLVFDYLYTNTTRKDISVFTLLDMIIACGYKPNTRSGRVNDQFKDILLFMYKNHYIVDCNFDVESFKAISEATDLLKCRLNFDFNSNYFLLYESEKNKILSYNESGIDNLKLLVFYCYLKSRIYKRNNNDDLSMFGGRSEVAWLTYENINADLMLSTGIINKYNKLLVDLNLIRIKNCGFWYFTTEKNPKIKESPNFYTLFNGDENECQLHLDEGIKYYKSLERNKGKIFIDIREYKHNNRKINGLYGYLIKKEKQGKATIEDIALKKQIFSLIQLIKQEGID